MKRREGGKRDRSDRVYVDPFSGHDVVRAVDFDRVWIFEPAAYERARKVHYLVVVFVFADRRGDWVGDVSVFALTPAAEGEPPVRCVSRFTIP